MGRGRWAAAGASAGSADFHAELRARPAACSWLPAPCSAPRPPHSYGWARGQWDSSKWVRASAFPTLDVAVSLREPWAEGVPQKSAEASPTLPPATSPLMGTNSTPEGCTAGFILGRTDGGAKGRCFPPLLYPGFWTSSSLGTPPCGRLGIACSPLSFSGPTKELKFLGLER